MSKIIGKYPCLSCSSSDAMVLYENNDGTNTANCFSCETFFGSRALIKAGIIEDDGSMNARIYPQQSGKTVKDFTFNKLKEIQEEYPIRGFKERGIPKIVCEHYGVKVSYDSDGQIDSHYYPYDKNSYKIRELPKDFRWEGKASKKLFGQDKFNGAGRKLIITEGEIDALSVATASYNRYKKFYPIVGMSSASGTKALLEQRSWIRSFQEVILCGDQDEAGEKALREAAKIIGYDKVKIVKLPEGKKDANEVLIDPNANGKTILMEAIFDATKFVPSGIIAKEDIWTQLEEYNAKQSIPYPKCMHGVNKKIKGMRGGEITLFISGTGSGKSTMFREVMLELIENTEDKIGVISLEESPAETSRKLAGMALNRNPADQEIPLEELREGFDKVFQVNAEGEERIVLLDHQGSMNDESIIEKLEYMALNGCKYLFIDHITILVSEGVENLQGLEAQDKVMNDLLRIVKRYPDVWIGLISHLRKAPNGKKSFEDGKLPTMDDIRGSGSIKQISMDIIAFARNMNAESEDERNTIKMAVLKARFTGLTGPVEGSQFIHRTGRLQPLDFIPEDNDGDFTSI